MAARPVDSLFFFSLKGFHEGDKSGYVVGINSSRSDIDAILVFQHFCQSVAFAFCAAGNHDVCEDVGILSQLVSGNSSYTATTNL